MDEDTATASQSRHVDVLTDHDIFRAECLTTEYLHLAPPLYNRTVFMFDATEENHGGRPKHVQLKKLGQPHRYVCV